MGVCISQEKEEENTLNLGKLPLSEEFKHSILLSSKQLNPAEDTTRQLLSLYYQNHKAELEPNITQIYIDALSYNTEELITVNFLSYPLVPRQTKFLSIVLPYCTELKRLLLSGTELGNTGIKNLTKAFSKLQNLLQLEIADNQITTEGFEYFVKGAKFLNKLEILDISRNEINLNGVVNLAESLKDRKSLRELIMTGLKLDNQMLNALNKAFFDLKLQSLNLADNDISDYQEILALKSLGLESLNISKCKFDSESKKALTENFLPISLII